MVRNFNENEIAERFSELLKLPRSSLSIKVRHAVHGEPEIDFLIRAGGKTFAIECKTSSSTAHVASAIEHLKRSIAADKLIRVVVVPYMGEVGRQLCKEAKVNWVDLSGNAEVTAPGLLIHVEGRPNAFKQMGRPSNVFAPMSSRIARWLLINWYSAWTIRGLARSTKMDPGFTSRIVTRLEAEGFVRRAGDLVKVRDPDLLLDAWRAEYKFFQHHIIRGHIATRSSEDLTQTVAKKFASSKIEYAATGLSAAWLLTRFGGFRLSTLYLRERPDTALFHEIGFREDPKGANIWLVLPNDEGVFQGARMPEAIEGVTCVHPLQVYLDLKDHPERAGEAATEVRERFLTWRTNGKEA